MQICATYRSNRSTQLCLFILGSSSVLLLMLAYNFYMSRHSMQSVPLLPYQADTEAKTLLKGLLKIGGLLSLARSIQDNAEPASLTEHYPVLSMAGHNFSALDGRLLSTEAVLRDSLLPSEDKYPVPNVAHFFMFSTAAHKQTRLQFHEYLGLLSAFWLSGIDRLVLWCNVRPVGKYWNMFVLNVTTHGFQDRIMFATRPLPTSVFNSSVHVIQHQVDLMKLQSAILFGGIILDTDSVTLRSLQPLRRHACVIGREIPDGLSIGALMVKPSSTFVLIWYMLYQTFRDSEWAVHSILLPDKIWRTFPRLCHVENDTMMRPNWYLEELNMLYKTFSNKTRRWNWDKNYMVHLWGFNRPIETKISVRTLNSMYGQVARHILYGTKDLLH